MIIKKLGAQLWRFFDVICFIAAAVCIDIAAFQGGIIWFCLSLAATFIFFGWLSEQLASQKGGD